LRNTLRAQLLLLLTMSALLGSFAIMASGQKPKEQVAAASLAHFESKVRPLLLASCVSCHGKDTHQAGLRLDVAVPPEKAHEILKRIRGEGGKPKMPPGKELTNDKIAAIEQWVKDGAPWGASTSLSPPSLLERGKTHWAFQPVVRTSVPRVKNTAWVRNPIDNFVLSRLESKGLKPNAPAARRELIRRVTYDLIGLPPTPEEVARFEADRAPDAYDKLVDRLLASPHYGEKWARHWLDLVRYAETNSYERDNPKPYAYKYRDYVIRAFNSDKPYDRFVKEQIAGDEMPDATGDCYAATGYYRLGIWDDEPADKLQASYDDLDDLVATTGQTFLGLTLDCARCHDHKLDPIPQKDYYSFLAFFHNINRFKNGGPTDEAQYFASAEKKVEFERKTAELGTRRKAFNEQIEAIEKRLAAKGSEYYNPGDVTDLSYRYYERDWKRIPEFENEPVIASGNLGASLISLKPRQRNEEFAIEYDGKLNVPKDGEYTFKFKAEGGYRFTVGGEKLFESFAVAGKPEERMAKKRLSAGKVGLNLIFNQRQNQHGFAISWSGPGFTERPLSSPDSCGTDGLTTLFGQKLPQLLDKETADRMTQLVNDQAALEKQAIPTEKVLCVTEAGPKPPETFVLKRGMPGDPGDKVEPAFPICLGGSAIVKPEPTAGARSSGLRTQLANWLASPENPLTARVIVNRVWQQHFGRGIVRTASDFGLTGAKPTHPELLNWLAKRFVEGGWSFKKLHKLILTSSTYMQSSHSNALAFKSDPQNDQFWRVDMRRLTAEEIRDSILAVSGNLNPALYGPSVYPEIPKEILAAQSRPGKDWYTERMTPEDVCRRSIYISVKRSLIYPFTGSFDLPETDRSSAGRFASTQPTQALAMMNGSLLNKQAAILAERVRKEAGTGEQAFARRLFSLTMQRSPTEAEVAEGVKLLDRLLKRGAKPDQAQKYLCLMALNLDEFVYVD